MKIYLFVEPADMRKGINGLSGLVSQGQLDPLNGHSFIFISKRRNAVKILYWDRGGYVIWYKRLEQGTLIVPPVIDASGIATMDAGQLAMLLDGVDLSRVRRVPAWAPPLKVAKEKSTEGIDSSSQL